MANLETLLATLASAPKECLYALVNKKDKHVQIFSTANFISHISKVTQELNTLKYKSLAADLDKIEVVILETSFGTGPTSRPNKLRKHESTYKKDGWTFYKDLNLARWKLKEGYKQWNQTLYYVLELETKAGQRCVVGVFSKAKDASSWKAANYPLGDNIVVEVVVADNELTRSWLEKYI